MENNDIKMPNGSIYELEYKYWPWGKLVNFIKNWLIENAPRSSYVIDYMCGTGYLLNEIASLRNDLLIEGCSITSENIDYGSKTYSNVQLHLIDVMRFIPREKASVIIAAGGLHHLRRSKQKIFIKKVHNELIDGGYFILGEEVIRHYQNDIGRIKAVKELFSAYIDEIVLNPQAPQVIKEAVLDLYKIDLFELGEYKSSIEMLTNMINKYFSIEYLKKIWPDNDVPYGDIVMILKKK